MEVPIIIIITIIIGSFHRGKQRRGRRPYRRERALAGCRSPNRTLGDEIRSSENILT
jgi:hypothetical protein